MTKKKKMKALKIALLTMFLFVLVSSFVSAIDSTPEGNAIDCTDVRYTFCDDFEVVGAVNWTKWSSTVQSYYNQTDGKLTLSSATATSDIQWNTARLNGLLDWTYEMKFVAYSGRNYHGAGTTGHNDDVVKIFLGDTQNSVLYVVNNTGTSYTNNNNITVRISKYDENSFDAQVWENGSLIVNWTGGTDNDLNSTLIPFFLALGGTGEIYYVRSWEGVSAEDPESVNYILKYRDTATRPDNSTGAGSWEYPSGQVHTMSYTNVTNETFMNTGFDDANGNDNTDIGNNVGVVGFRWKSGNIVIGNNFRIHIGGSTHDEVCGIGIENYRFKGNPVYGTELDTDYVVSDDEWYHMVGEFNFTTGQGYLERLKVRNSTADSWTYFDANHTACDATETNGFTDIRIRHKSSETFDDIIMYQGLLDDYDWDGLWGFEEEEEIPPEPTEFNITGCGTLNDSGTYYLTANVTNHNADGACIDIDADDITLDCQNNILDSIMTSDSNNNGNNDYAIYSDNHNITIKNCQITQWQIGITLEGNDSLIENNILDTFRGYGNMGGGSGLPAYGIQLTGHHNIIRNNDITDVQGGYSSSNGAVGRDSFGIYLDGGDYNYVHDNNISSVRGGRGKSTSSTSGADGDGGDGFAISLNNADYNNITDIRIWDVDGGAVGTPYGAKDGTGGMGGIGLGLSLLSSTNNILDSIVMWDIDGGTSGGTSCSNPDSGAGGTGGLGGGISLESSTDNTFTLINISDLRHGSVDATCTEQGARGVSTGIWFKDVTSYDNSITPTIVSGAYNIPDSSLYNILEGKPLLHFYNQVDLNVSYYDLDMSATDDAPFMLLGDYQSSGGNGGNASGIVLINVNDSIIKHNTVKGFYAMSPHPVLSGWGIFNDGGDAFGIYLSNGNGNTIDENIISDLEGGQGCTGGNSITGGDGGKGIGIEIVDSDDTNIGENDVTGLDVGLAGYGQAGLGEIGITYSLYMLGVTSSLIYENNLVGNYSIHMSGSSSNTIYNNLFNVTTDYADITTDANSWNTSQQAGTRIYGTGSYIGGNYYTNPSATGYSDSCGGEIGICSEYTLATNNVDYLPLGQVDTAPTINSSAVVDLGNNQFNITAVISDDNGISSAIVEIEEPSTTKTNYSMTDAGNDVYYYIYTADEIGTHSFLMYANDTSNNRVVGTDSSSSSDRTNYYYDSSSGYYVTDGIEGDIGLNGVTATDGSTMATTGWTQSATMYYTDNVASAGSVSINMTTATDNYFSFSNSSWEGESGTKIRTTTEEGSHGCGLKVVTTAGGIGAFNGDYGSQTNTTHWGYYYQTFDNYALCDENDIPIDFGNWNEIYFDRTSSTTFDLYVNEVLCHTFDELSYSGVSSILVSSAIMGSGSGGCQFDEIWVSNGNRPEDDAVGAGSFTGVDLESPTINSSAVVDLGNNQFNITAVITDVSGISSAIVEIEEPSATKTNYSMTDAGNDVYYYIYTADEIGTHNFLMYANDTVNNRVIGSEGGYSTDRTSYYYDSSAGYYLTDGIESSDIALNGSIPNADDGVTDYGWIYDTVGSGTTYSDINASLGSLSMRLEHSSVIYYEDINASFEGTIRALIKVSEGVDFRFMFLDNDDRYFQLGRRGSTSTTKYWRYEGNDHAICDSNMDIIYDEYVEFMFVYNQTTNNLTTYIDGEVCADRSGYTGMKRIFFSLPSAGSLNVDEFSVSNGYIPEADALGTGSFTGVDLVSPTINSSSLVDLGNNQFNITAVISDDNGISSAIVEIEEPSATKTNYSMTDAGNDVYYYVYTASEIGTHNFLMYANDTVNNRIIGTEGGYSTNRTEYYYDGSYYITDNIDDADTCLNGGSPSDGTSLNACGYPASSATYSNTYASKGDLSVKMTGGATDISYNIPDNSSFLGSVGFSMLIPCSGGSGYAGSKYVTMVGGQAQLWYKTSANTTHYSYSEGDSNFYKCNENDISFTCDEWATFEYRRTNLTHIDGYINGVLCHQFGGRTGIAYAPVYSKHDSSTDAYFDEYWMSNGDRPSVDGAGTGSFTGLDLVSPTIHSVDDVNVGGDGITFNVTANVSDNIDVTSVTLEITDPLSAKTNYSMVEGGDDIWSYNFVASEYGDHSYLIYASDAQGNVVQTTASYSETPTDYYNDGTYYVTDSIDDADTTLDGGTPSVSGESVTAGGWSGGCVYTSGQKSKGTYSLWCNNQEFYYDINTDATGSAGLMFNFDRMNNPSNSERRILFYDGTGTEVCGVGYNSQGIGGLYNNLYYVTPSDDWDASKGNWHVSSVLVYEDLWYELVFDWDDKAIYVNDSLVANCSASWTGGITRIEVEAHPRFGGLYGKPYIDEIWVASSSDRPQGNTFYAGDLTDPLFSSQSKNETPDYNEDVSMSITITDDNADSYMFFWNATGSYVNETPQTYTSGVPVSTVKTVSYPHANICWGYWANDTFGNSVASSVDCFTVGNSVPTKPVVYSPLDSTSYLDVDVEYSSTDAEGDPLTYNVYIDSVLNQTTSNNISSLVIGDGTYDLYVTATDGYDTSVQSDTVTFTKDTTAPVITIVSPTGGQTYNTVPIWINWTTDETSTCSVNSSYWTETVNTGTAFAYENDNSTPNDYYTVLISCNDSLLNNAEDSISFRYDSEAPMIVSTKPSEDNSTSEYSFGEFDPSVTVSDNNVVHNYSVLIYKKSDLTEMYTFTNDSVNSASYTYDPVIDVSSWENTTYVFDNTVCNTIVCVSEVYEFELIQPYAPQITVYAPTTEYDGALGEDILFDIEANDSNEGELITYAWEVDDVQVATDEDYTYPLSAGYIGLVYTIKVTATDDSPLTLTDVEYWNVTVVSGHHPTYEASDFTSIVVDGIGTAGAFTVGWLELLMILLILSVGVISIWGYMKR